jgi:hypothetical protein
MGMGVSHTFIYDFLDDANQTFGIVAASLNQKQSYQVVQRIMPWLAGSVQTGDMFVNPTYSDLTFDYANFYGFSFQNGGVSVGVAWTDNSYPSQAFTSHQGRLSFTHPGTHERGRIERYYRRIQSSGLVAVWESSNRTERPGDE